VAENKFKKELTKVDLLLTDVIMPHGNGRILAGKLCGIKPDLKVLFMSGYTDDVIADHGALEPDINLLQKPFSAEGLLKRIREMLDT